MEWGGDEKRIQALFSELSFEDQSRVPQFGRVWTRAQARKEIGFSRPVAVLISVLVTAVACASAIWAWYRLAPTPVQGIVNVQPQPQNQLAVVSTPQPVKVVVDSQPEKVRRRPRKTFVRQRQIDRSLTTELALLSNWESPTQRLLESPTGLVLNSLPQLNQSVKDLQSFLPKNTEVIKESNQ